MSVTVVIAKTALGGKSGIRKWLALMAFVRFEYSARGSKEARGGSGNPRVASSGPRAPILEHGGAADVPAGGFIAASFGMAASRLAA